MRGWHRSVQWRYIIEYSSNSPVGNWKVWNTCATILSDNGSCFVSVRRKEPKKSWNLTASENNLLGRGIELINSRLYRPIPTASLNDSTGALKSRYTTTRTCWTILNTTTRDVFTFHLTCVTTRHHSRHFRPWRQQRQSEQKTHDG